MSKVVFTYDEVLGQAGSRQCLENKVKRGELFKVARGVYSTEKYPDPIVTAHVLYPDAVITMDSALFAYGFTDTPPDKVHLATAREATRISRPGYRQYFTGKELLAPGAVELDVGQGVTRIYNQERLLVEVMRRQAILPLDYYREAIDSYRRIAEGLDIRLIEDYIALFKRQDAMYDILQREVL